MSRLLPLFYLRKRGGKVSTSIDSLDIQISASANSANSEISTLITRLSALQKSLTSVGGSGFKNYTSNASKATKQTQSFGSMLNKMNNSANRTAKSTKNLAYAFSKFYANYFLFVRAFKGLFNSIESTADYIEAFNYFNVALGKIGSEWSHQFEKYGYENAEVYAESFNQRLTQSLSGLSGVQISMNADGSGLLAETGMKNLGLNIKEVTQYASQLASVTNSVGQTGEVSLAASNAFTKLGADISSLFNLDYSAVMTNLQSGLIGQSRALYKYGIDITNATLQTYAYELGLSKAVSEMTQAEKMQLRMIAILDQSKVSWGDLANTIESPSNLIRQFANNLKEAGMVLGQLFIPLLQKVLPVINGATIAIKRLLVNIAGFLGISLDLSSFGQGYSDMADDASSLSDSLDDATASAKKLKTATLGIDELNINAPQDDASSSGEGISTIDLTDEIISATDEYQKVWQEAFDKMESKAQAFADTFEKMFAPIGTIFEDIALGDFLKLGEDVSDLAIDIFDFFTDAIAKVNWNMVGTEIGKFFKGIKWTKVLDSIGRFIWTAVNSALVSWKGMFDVAPLETAIITAAGLLKFTSLGKMIMPQIKASILSALATPGGIVATIAIGISAILIGIDQAYIDAQVKAFEEEQIQKYGDTLQNIYDKAAEAGREIAVFNEETRAQLALKDDNVLYLEKLAEQYEVLASKATLTGVEEEKLKNISEQLVAQLPALEEYYDDEKGYIVATAEALRSMISEKEKEIKLNALSEYWTETMKQQIEAQKQLKDNVEALELAESELEAIMKIVNAEIEKHGGNANLSPYQEDVAKAEEAVNKLSEAVCANIESLNSIDDQVTFYEDLYEDILNAETSMSDASNAIGATIPNGVATGIEENAYDARDKASALLQSVKETMEGVSPEEYNDIGQNIVDGIGVPIKEATLAEPIASMYNTMVSEIKEKFGIHSPAETMKPLGGFMMSGITVGFSDGFAEFGKTFDSFYEKYVKPWFDSSIWNFAGIKDGLSIAWNNAIDAIKGIWNSFSNWLNDKLTWTIDPVSIGGMTIFDGATINLGKLPTYSTGGFPEDGLFMANHNELVGQFSNGKTAVANNEQIVAGITAGVREANSEEIYLLRQQNELLTRLLEKDMSVNIGDRDIARANARGQKSLGYQLVT